MKRQRWGRGMGGALLAGVAASLWAAGPAASPEGALAAQNVSGLDVFRSNCDGCHELPDPERPRRTRAEWEAVLNLMVREKGAALNRQEFAAVLNYLDSFNQAERRIAWNDARAVTHRAVLDAASVGKLPEPWVPISVGRGSQAGGEPAWSLQKDAAGRELFLAPTAAGAAGRHHLLIDNSGVVTDGSVSARVRIPAAAGAAGAGIVFGFRTPQSYFGARLSPAARAVLLYQVEQGEPALVGRAPNPVPAGRWTPLAATLRGNQVQIAVDGKTVLTRPLPGYRGGHVGIAVDGATVAAFDGWSVEVRNGR